MKFVSPSSQIDSEGVKRINEIIQESVDRMKKGKYKYAPVSLRILRRHALSEFFKRKEYEFSLAWEQIATAYGLHGLDGTRGQFKYDKGWRYKIGTFICNLLRL